MLIAQDNASQNSATNSDNVPVTEGEYTIAGLNVEGTQYSDKAAIMTLSGLKVGQVIRIPGPELSEAMRKLWKQSLFSDIKIEAERVVGNKLFLLIRCEERPRISKYSFSGVTKQQADDLKEKIKFIRGQRFTEPKKRTAIRTIQRYFQEKGYHTADVQVTTEADPSVPNGLIITLKIKKGPRVKVKQIIIKGLEKTEVNKLKRKLKNTKERRFWRVWSRSKYITAKFNEDKKAAVAFLLTQGFRDAKIVSDTVRQISPKRVVVELNVYEGSKYYFRNISWTGNTKYTSGRLDTILGIKKGETYNQELLDRRLSMDPAQMDVSSLYLDDGYLFFRAEPVETLVDGDSIDLEIRVFEGPQATYDKIIIEGNTKTSDYVIRRELFTRPGNKFSRAEIIRSQREILNLGYFNQENMQITPLPNLEKGTVDIKYVVEERPSDQFMVQAGWGGRIRDSRGNVINSGLVGTVGLTFNNFSTRKILRKSAWDPLPSGDGQRLSLRAQSNGVGWQNYALSFMEPWFGGRKPNSLGFSTNYSLQRVIGSEYRMAILGSSLDLGTRMKVPDDYFRSFTSIGYRYYAFRNAFNVFPELNNGHVNILSVRQTFDRTSIDVPIFPTKGSALIFSVEATPPWHLFIQKDYKTVSKEQKIQMLEFHKWKFKSETYTKLTNIKLPLVLYTRAQMGFLGLYNRDLGISPFERFYIGGDGLFGMNFDGREIYALRGYSQPFLGPSNGGTIMSKFSLELRQPVSLAPTATLWFHGFVEGGNAWGNFDNFNPFVLKRSAGFGVRVFLPMFGLLGVDWGYGLDPGNSQVKNGANFHFMIGQQF